MRPIYIERHGTKAIIISDTNYYTVAGPDGTVVHADTIDDAIEQAQSMIESINLRQHAIDQDGTTESTMV